MISNTGLFDIQTDSKIANGNGGAAPSFKNAGTLRKSQGFATTIAIQLDNSALVQTFVGDIVPTSEVRLSNGSQLIGAGRLLIGSSAYITLAGTVSTANIEIAGGGILGTGTISGTLHWSGGYISGGTVTIAAGSELTITGSAVKTISVSTLLNQGTVHWQQGNLIVSSNGIISNTGLFDIQTDARLYGNASVGYVKNAGILRKSAGTLSSIEVELDNSGQIDTAVGDLIPSGGAYLQTGTRLTGAGRFLVSGSAGIHLQGTVDTQNFELSGGYITGAGVISGTMKWSGGSIESGSVVVPAGSSVLLSSTALKYIIAATLTNQGTMTWQNGNIQMYAGAVLSNTGTFDAQGDARIYDNNAGASPSFQNAGIFSKSAGATTPVQLPFVNSGQVNVQVGAVQLDNSLAQLNDGSVIGGAGRFLLGSGSTTTVNGLVSSQNMEVADGILNGAGTVTGTLKLTSGEIDCAVTIGGTLNWSGGSMSGGIVAPNGTLNITSSSTKSLFSGLLLNKGTVNWSGGTIQMYDGAVISNTALFDAQSNTMLNNSSSGATAPVFNNSGVLRKSAGLSTSFRVLLNNTGTIDVRTDSLVPLGGALLKTGTQLIGNGSFLLASGASATLTGTVVSQNMEIGGGVLDGAGTISGTLKWTGGDIDNGTAVIGPNGTLNISGSADKYMIGSTLVNRGTINWQAGALALANGAVISNTATFEVQSDARMYHFFSTGATPLFANSGTLRKASTSGTTTFQFPVQNSGSLDAFAGTLNFSAGMSQAAGLTLLSGGNVQGALNILGGRLSGSGTVTGDVTNAGIISPSGSPTLLTISGKLNQAASGVVEVELAGTAAGQFDQLAISGAASINGSLAIVLPGGYMPNLGDVFQVMTFASSSGTFTSLNGNQIDSQRQIEPLQQH